MAGMNASLVVALPGGEQLAAQLAAALDCELTGLVVHTFPDRETLVRLDATVKGRCVILAGSLNDPDTKTLPLLFAADAARELGALQVGLVAPYLAYMRQDRRFHRGEAVTSRSYARLLSSALDFLVTVDPHLHRWHSLDELYAIRTYAVESAGAIASWVAEHVDHPLIVGPDEESAQWVERVANLADAGWTVMGKTRTGDRDVAVNLDAKGLGRYQTPVLLDDIVSSGATLVAAAAALERAGLRKPVCIAVHALFAADAQRQLEGARIERMVTTDSVPHATNAIRLAPQLAAAVRLAIGSSVSHQHRQCH